MRYWEMQELAAAAMGWTEDQYEAELNGDEDFDTPLYDKFGIDFEQFSKVAEALLKLTPTVESVVSGEIHHAFVNQIGNGNFRAIVKLKA